jgi:hypothetical protein
MPPLPLLNGNALAIMTDFNTVRLSFPVHLIARKCDDNAECNGNEINSVASHGGAILLMKFDRAATAG